MRRLSLFICTRICDITREGWRIVGFLCPKTCTVMSLSMASLAYGVFGLIQGATGHALKGSMVLEATLVFLRSGRHVHGV